MGKRDYRQRETKKPKKDTKKSVSSEVISSPSDVEIIKKKKKERNTEQED